MARRPTKETKTVNEPAPPVNTVSTGRPSAFNGLGWIYGLLTAIFILLIFMAGMAVASHQNRNDGLLDRQGITDGGLGMRHGFGGAIGPHTSLNDQSRVTGVVISVNGSSFTIAGNGATTNVTTSNSTKYSGGDQVKQNDSVIVWGAESNGSIQASQIVINP